MRTYEKIANDLTRSLHLSQLPVAISLADVPPAGVDASMAPFQPAAPFGG
jgi:hypothetical protein